MTKPIYFITPHSIVKVVYKLGEFAPGIGSSLSFTKKAEKLTKLTDPVSASARGIGLVFNFCFGKAGAVSAECILAFFNKFIKKFISSNLPVL